MPSSFRPWHIAVIYLGVGATSGKIPVSPSRFCVLALRFGWRGPCFLSRILRSPPSRKSLLLGDSALTLRSWAGGVSTELHDSRFGRPCHYRSIPAFSFSRASVVMYPLTEE